jgi:hypothetical protein
LIGIGEIVLLPLDVLKIKRQTNPDAFRGRGLFKIVRDEGFGLYRGWGWTAARNAPGSFAVSFTTGRRSSLTMPAFRRLGGDQAVPVQARGLQQGELEPELRRVHRGRERVADRVGAARRYQDAHPEPQLREPGERLAHPDEHGA